jgi:selenocysteine lyase/cysteine desulfurase
MIDPLIDPSEFVGLEGVAHLCAGGEAPFLGSHLDVLARFARDKSDGMAGRERLFATYASTKQRLAERVYRPPADIALLAHVSEGINLIAQSLDWRPGDNVVLADVEFPSLIYPWTRLAQRGVETRIVPTRAGLIDLNDMRTATDERTRLIAASQVSFLTGQRLDVTELGELARSVDARLLIDATHALGVVPVDAGACDFLVSSCYKWLLAAHGVGIFVWNRERFPDLEPASLGWHSVARFGEIENPTEVVLRPDADRLEIGNPSFPSVYILDNALERLTRVSAAAVESHVCALGGQVRDGLVERGFRVLTPVEPSGRAGNVCFASADSQNVVARLAQRHVLVWGGEGRVRISVHLYNSSRDVDRLLDGLDSSGISQVPSESVQRAD